MLFNTNIDSDTYPVTLTGKPFTVTEVSIPRLISVSKFTAISCEVDDFHHLDSDRLPWTLGRRQCDAMWRIRIPIKWVESRPTDKTPHFYVLPTGFSMEQLLRLYVAFDILGPTERFCGSRGPYYPSLVQGLTVITLVRTQRCSPS